MTTPITDKQKLEQENAILRECLRERVFWTGGYGFGKFSREGYSLEVDEETAHRDIDYRNTPLYPTSDEAIDAFVAKIAKHMEHAAARAALGGGEG
jgi:hypothetical protein